MALSVSLYFLRHGFLWRHSESEYMRRGGFVIFFIVLLLLTGNVSAQKITDQSAVDTSSIPYGVIDTNLLPIGYSGQEKLSYDISWSGGIKIGELHLEINRLDDAKEEYEIKALVTTKNGALNLFYPVKDVYVTKVRGPKRLPYNAEIWQKEGYSYRSHKVIEYDQERGEIKSIRNNKLDWAYEIEGEANNEFSSFFNSRLMQLKVGEKFIVPTFADKKRVEVVVNTVAKKEFEKTLLGPVKTVEVMPIMTFKGLYEKKGDTVIWYTDDECRVPMRINSKISIGSLTAELTEYQNPACKKYPAINN